MVAKRIKITVFKCLECGNSLHRFSPKTYMQARGYSYEFKCPCCRVRYEHVPIVSEIITLGVFLLFLRCASSVFEGYQIALLSLASIYLCWSICPVMRIVR